MNVLNFSVLEKLSKTSPLSIRILKLFSNYRKIQRFEEYFGVWDIAISLAIRSLDLVNDIGSQKAKENHLIPFVVCHLLVVEIAVNILQMRNQESTFETISQVAEEGLKCADKILIIAGKNGIESETRKWLFCAIETFQEYLGPCPLHETTIFETDSLEEEKPSTKPNNDDLEVKWGKWEDMIEMELPFRVSGLTLSWNAFRLWKDWSYLERKIGRRLVPVEIGGSYVESEWNQRLISYHSFLELVAQGSETVYLAQFNIFEYIPDLFGDIEIPHFLPEPVIINVWIGGKGTLSPLHYDPYDNFYVQIVGLKRFTLISPKTNPNKWFYPFPIDSKMHNTSQVKLNSDGSLSDKSKWPLFSNVSEIFNFVLGPGDSLFIPSGWWHQVESLSPSKSVSFWFDRQN